MYMYGEEKRSDGVVSDAWEMAGNQAKWSNFRWSACQPQTAGTPWIYINAQMCENIFNCSVLADDGRARFASKMSKCVARALDSVTICNHFDTHTHAQICKVLAASTLHCSHICMAVHVTILLVHLQCSECSSAYLPHTSWVHFVA